MKKRHTCIICKRKRYEAFMINVFNDNWACETSLYYFQEPCYVHSDIYKIKQIINISDSLSILCVIPRIVLSGVTMSRDKS